MRKIFNSKTLFYVPTLLVLATLPALAQAPGQETGQQGPIGPQLMSMLFPIALCVFIFYLIVWRPESKRRKQHAEKVNALRKNDRVVTAGGIHGTVATVKGRTVIVKVDDTVKLEISKSAISTIVSRDDEMPPNEAHDENG